MMGAATSEIARFSEQKSADMIVIGTHGRKGLARLLNGNTVEALLRQAPCQVVVVKQRVVPDHWCLQGGGTQDPSNSHQPDTPGQ